MKRPLTEGNQEAPRPKLSGGRGRCAMQLIRKQGSFERVTGAEVMVARQPDERLEALQSVTCKIDLHQGLRC
ncbi:hypothetical protein ACE8DK_17730 [Xanthomonas euvesicatoria pv. euvesicatoria]|uniref:hypothetical protein n=1 Tax=Xanthomonas TaxID=338 RepID=UPI000FFF2FD1|nr:MULTISPECIES: hypothetical protein [Xanthomonas]